MDLIDQMVASQWRRHRIWVMQTAALDLKMDQQDAEIAPKFHQIDQASRVTVAFITLANDESRSTSCCATKPLSPGCTKVP